jgi:lipopolysaccharide/colanic/teichoic acid biosynthesis glycosyltransferase
VWEREKRGVFDARPGVTGMAQVMGIDMSTPQLLAEMDSKMLQGITIKNYFEYITITLFGAGFGDRIDITRKLK